jgi:hypothetical protein
MKPKVLPTKYFVKRNIIVGSDRLTILRFGRSSHYALAGVRVRRLIRLTSHTWM